MTVVGIFGATGGTGLHLVKTMLDRKLAVRALVRTPAKLYESIPAESLTVVQGDSTDAKNVQELVDGCEVVIICLGGPLGGKVCSLSQPVINTAITSSSTVRRVVLVTSLGCGSSFNDASFLSKMVFSSILASTLRDKNIQEELLVAALSSATRTIPWTIVRPGRLTDLPKAGKVEAMERGCTGGKISREDVAEFIVDRCVVADGFFNKHVSLVGGK